MLLIVLNALKICTLSKVLLCHYFALMTLNIYYTFWFSQNDLVVLLLLLFFV